jgi:hypothetical protein
MKKILVLLCLVLTLVVFVGCYEVVSEKPIDARYTAAYSAMETVYGYKYDWWNGDWKYLPELKMVHHDEKYEVQYEVAYSDGSVVKEWRTVGKEEYDTALIEMGEAIT